MMRRTLEISVLSIILAAWSIFPIYWLVNVSFMLPVEIHSSPVHFYPYEPTIRNYIRAFGIGVPGIPASGHAAFIIRGLSNSLILALIVTSVTMLFATLAGYAFGRMSFPRKNALLFGLIGSRSLPPVSILIPYFFFFFLMGMTGTIHGLALIYLSLTIPLIAWVLMGFFATLPVEVERAARIDGCTRLQAITRVVLPMAKSGLASTAMLTFLISWNEFLFSYVLAGGTDAQTLPPALAAMFFQVAEFELMAAANTIALIPPIIIALLFQRYITQLRIVDPVTVVG